MLFWKAGQIGLGSPWLSPPSAFFSIFGFMSSGCLLFCEDVDFDDLFRVKSSIQRFLLSVSSDIFWLPPWNLIVLVFQLHVAWWMDFPPFFSFVEKLLMWISGGWQGMRSTTWWLIWKTCKGKDKGMLLCRTDDAILPIPRSAVLVCTCANMKETTKRPMAHISNNSATLKRHGLKNSFLPSSIPTDPIDLPVLIVSPYPTCLPLLWWLCSRRH